MNKPTPPNPVYQPARYTIELTVKVTLGWEEGEFPENGDITPLQQLVHHALDIDENVLPDTNKLLDMFGDHYDNARDLWDSVEVLEVTSELTTNTNTNTTNNEEEAYKE